MQIKKIIVLLGSTAVGKSALAVKIARDIGGEIICADSRQVYKGLDLGSGKITMDEMKGVPHHMLDVANLMNRFTVTQYKKMADEKIIEIIARGNVPIICGGTGFYVDAVVKGLNLPEVPPDKKLRERLALKSAALLFSTLKKLDPARARNIDAKNKVRLIRAIEIAKSLGRVPPIVAETPPYDFIKIGLKLPDESLKRKLKLRVKKRIQAGMAVEIYDMRARGVPWKRFMELGFDQKFISLYLQNEITEKELLHRLFMSNWHYAKRQMRWFKRDAEIKWFNPKDYFVILRYLETH